MTLTIKDGRVFDLSWATVGLSDGSRIGIGQDITERKRTEALTGQQTAQIETRVRRLGQAMRETDHRIKNNLQSIAAFQSETSKSRIRKQNLVLNYSQCSRF